MEMTDCIVLSFRIYSLQLLEQERKRACAQQPSAQGQAEVAKDVGRDRPRLHRVLVSVLHHLHRLRDLLGLEGDRPQDPVVVLLHRPFQLYAQPHHLRGVPALQGA